MCTYSFTLDDRLISRIMPRFKNTESMQQWLQQELELLLIHHAGNYQTDNASPDKEAARKKILDIAAGKKKISFSDLKGILAGSTLSAEEHREEYLTEKYGL